jgi:energy-coupling factor transport system ATP-binding protein
MLNLSNVSAGYGGAVVNRAVSFEVGDREIVALIGRNGVGKSTLALTLAGLLPPVSGEVRATPTLQTGAGPHPHRWRSRELLTRIGTVFQDPAHQFLARTVREELEVGPRALGSEDAAAIDELLDRLRLAHLARANPFTLSGGEQRRLSVATALATAPRVLVLDEPTFGQDARTWAELVALLAELRDDGVALVAVTHDDEVVRALAAERFALTSGVVA